MPNHLFEWLEHIKEIEREYRATRSAVDRLKDQVTQTPDQFEIEERRSLIDADQNLEGTYLVRLFAAFEAALRSYDRVRHHDPERTQNAAILIDSTGGRNGQGISTAVRQGAHEVRRLRNYWAHENEMKPNVLTLAESRARLLKYLSWLPPKWG